MSVNINKISSDQWELSNDGLFCIGDIYENSIDSKIPSNLKTNQRGELSIKHGIKWYSEYYNYRPCKKNCFHDYSKKCPQDWVLSGQFCTGNSL